MDNLYSLFYTGQQNPYGPGAWDSRGRKLKHSSSQPFLYGKKKLYLGKIRKIPMIVKI